MGPLLLCPSADGRRRVKTNPAITTTAPAMAMPAQALPDMVSLEEEATGCRLPPISLTKKEEDGVDVVGAAVVGAAVVGA